MNLRWNLQGDWLPVSYRVNRWSVHFGSCMQGLGNTIDTKYYTLHLPSSESSLRSDVPTIADMKIITATTMPITIEALPQESTMIRCYTWQMFQSEVVARSWRGGCKFSIKMTDKFDIKIICILLCLYCIFFSKSVIFGWIGKQYRKGYLLSRT